MFLDESESQRRSVASPYPCVNLTLDANLVHAFLEGLAELRMMDADALAIREGRPPRVPGEEGWRDMRVLDAIFASARDGGTRVEIAAG